MLFTVTEQKKNSGRRMIYLEKKRFSHFSAGMGYTGHSP